MKLSTHDLKSFIHAIRTINAAPCGPLPLHAPVFQGQERAYVLDAIDSTFVSSVGEYVGRFENMLCDITGARHAVACVNGTTALHMALLLAGTSTGDLILTQALSFVATSNAIAHCGAQPVFLDVDEDTLGLSPEAVHNFLQKHAERRAGHADGCFHKASGRRIAACIPMHTFGLPCRIIEITDICASWGIPVVEDAAEALGSAYQGRHCGTYGHLGILSFNGNKIVTTGGGGAILTNDAVTGKRARHLTTTAKVAHPWAFQHDAVGWNYRMPNLNAALGCAQLERLESFLLQKRRRAADYSAYFADTPWRFITESSESYSNYWLCSVLAPSATERDSFLEHAHAQGVQARPAWDALHTLPMYANCLRDDLHTTTNMVNRLINLPSSVAFSATHAEE